MQDSASVGAQCADDLFLADRDPLNRIEVEELGDVAGKRFLHLQCHFGIDTLGWARRGALVTGVDFSPEAIATARALAVRAGLDARFVEADVYALGSQEQGGWRGREVVTALVGAGLQIVWLREYPRSPYPFPGFLEKRPEGDYGWPGGREDVPLTFSIGAR